MQSINQEIDSLVPPTSFSDGLVRRDFLKAALGAGIAAAALPARSATMIDTDAKGLTAGTVSIPAGDRDIPAYLAQPEGKTGLPVILVVSEIFGVHHYIADVARRFAKEGYLALAPDLFVRQGDPNAYASVGELMKNLIAKVPDAQVMKDLDACAAWAGTHGGDANRLGINGFCWGGRIVWLYAAHNPKLKAGVSWYGRLVNDKTPATPTEPLGLVAEIKAPVLGLYGVRDAGIPVATVEDMRLKLQRAGKESDFVIYPDAGHGFHADYRPGYVKEDAEDGWKRALEWFGKHGVG